MESIKHQLKSSYTTFKEKFQERSVEDNWKDFKGILQTVMATNIPQKVLSGRNHIPWMTYSIKKKIRQKQRLYNRAKQSGKDEDWKKFKNVRSEVKTILEQSHHEYVMKLLSNEEGQQTTTITKKFWRYIKNQKRDNCGVSPLKVDNRIHEGNKEKAGVLSNQFQSVFTQEDTSHMPSLTEEPRLPSIGQLLISTNGVKKLLSNIDPKKACGPDEIPCRIMKERAEEIAPYLKDIYQQSIDNNVVPEDWRSANITCLFKKGDRSVPANYRPVSLTSVPCKILEHIIFRHINTHLDRHKFLVDYQHGFRSQRSCETQLISTLEEITRSVDQKRQVDMLILDFSKAFDTVAHQRLLLKLEHCGIRGKMLQWLSSWLTNRKQCVVVDGEFSNEVMVTSGVPQGTVLGPLMFLIYVNNIGKGLSSRIRLFADDALLYKEIRSQEDADILQDDLSKLERWSVVWQMSFNPQKCTVLRVHRKRNPVRSNYQLLGHTLEESQSSKYLGVEISSDLKWNSHIDAITSKANQTLGFLRRNLQKCPEKVKEQAYTALVRPHLEYASCAWDPYLKKNIEKIEAVQRKAARFVKSNYTREEGTVTALLKDLQWRSLVERRQQARLVMMFKIVRNLVAVRMPSYITKQAPGTRGYHELHFRQVSTRTDSYKYSFLPRTICEWNDLSTSVIECPCVVTFKSMLLKTVIF